ncbi:MAG: hypothetical protein FWH55_06050, partial [Oscillospiraceae bacterium]|nr:hypothetical protein [Oscillospiraceae bacterium]
DERCVAAGGWIANNQAPGVNALDFGEFVSVTDAIEKYGAGLSGKIEVAYVGGASAAPAVLDWDGNEIVKNVKYEAGFMPWIGHVYRTPLTGFYVYLDSAVGSRDYYMYRKILDPSSDRYDPDFVMPTAREVAMTAGHQYECEFTVNTTVTYPTNSGGADFDYAFGDNSSADWSLTNPGWTLDYTWTPGVVTRGAQTITQGPVTVDRPGQMTIDGFVRQSGGLLLGALSVRGNHPHKQPQSSGLGAGIGDTLRIEGNGGITFQSVDVAVLRDYNLALYRNESLILHEGGHGIDSAQGIYAQNLYNDMTSAFATATAPKNGMRWFTVDGVPCYVGSRGEYVSSGSTFWAGVMRESFEGVNDTVWTPNCNREELLRYDPYSFEALKRIKFNGDLGLWYEGRIGDPDYRVLPEDWELLRDQDPQFSHWTGENNLVAWGLSIKSIANYNPYTGQSNPLIRWISFNNPSLWDVEPYRAPTRDGWRSNIRYDFVGRNPYHPPEGDGPPTQSQTHPFFAGEGVKRPVRPYESLLLSKPVTGEISNIHIPYSPVLVEFELANYSGEVTMDNAPNSFELFVNGKLTHFYFWTFEEIAPGVAKVALRLEWPLDPDDFDKVTITLRPVPLEKVTPTAFVTKLNGNKNDLTISVVELYANGMTKETTKTYSIDNNAAGTYAVGDHKVYVATSGNTNITAISVVSSDPKGPFYVPPAERVLVNAVTSAKDIISSTGTAVTFKVTESYSDGSAEVVQKTVQIAKNSSGKIDLGAYYLVYDIAGNGSNVKTFNISMK